MKPEITRRHFLAASFGAASLVAINSIFPRPVTAREADFSSSKLPTLIISPGTDGGSTGGFQDGLQLLLKDAGVNFMTFEAPRGNQMRADIWVSRIYEQIMETQGPFALLGNSMGSYMMLLTASNYDFGGRLTEIFTFSCRYGEYSNCSNEAKAVYLNNPINPEAIIRNLGGRSPWISHSEDDQRIKYNPNANNLARALQTNVWPFRDQGHFETEAAGRTMFAVVKHAWKLPETAPKPSPF